MSRRDKPDEAVKDISTLSTEPKLLNKVALPEPLVNLCIWVVQSLFLGYAVYNAYRIRTYSLTEYGMVIHEFDPWFNFRATQYLSKHGWYEFFHWFDHMSWYPLGRPVGTTIYPGLQITAVGIHRILRWMGPEWKMSLNNVCCTMPCWFGAVTTFLMYLLTAECTGSRSAGVFAALIMAIVPAHMMRTVGGGFDNESIAMAALVGTFYFWVRALRTRGSALPFGLLAGVAYGYMVAAWGGYVFVLNMVAMHTGVLVLADWARNRYSSRLHIAYSCFYVVGTFIAIQIPVVGMTPFKSLEQILALLVFCGLQVLAFSETLRRKAKVEVRSPECFALRMRCVAYSVGVVVAVVLVLAPTGFFGPISSRVRGLFVQHTRTGNPLVDSVAEHQPASPDAYWHYLHFCCYGWQIGIFTMMLATKRFYAGAFLTLYAIVAYYFSLKMARLIILASPVATGMTGMVLSQLFAWLWRQFFWSDQDAAREALAAQGKNDKGKKVVEASPHTLDKAIEKIQYDYAGARLGRVALATTIVAVLLSGFHWSAFSAHCENMAHSFANPQLMFKSRGPDGRIVMIDDYREAYHWLRDTTPKDARVMAWWDYGYQITGIGERTSIADGNTWNHEHIATLGYMLTSPVKRAHSLIRHFADYVLVWAGGHGDDLAKSPHMARIGNSVYRDICELKDPLCMKFGFKGANHQDPTKMMRDSLLFNLHAHNQRPGVRVDPKYFQEAYTSKNGLVRIFKVMNVSEESKAWNADPANRKCDAPGSWYCEGQYPPAEPVQELIAKRVSFKQLEDFNVKGEDEYYKAYMRAHGDRG